MKKAFFGILIGILLLVMLIPGILWWGFGLANRWQFAADFESCEKEFNTIKDYVQSEYYDGETRRYFSVTGRLDGNECMYDSLNGACIQWPEDVMAAIEVADQKGFPQGECSLDIIWVETDRITFSSEGRAYRLVYMIEGRPDNMGETWFVKWIGDGWYHVTVNPNA